MKDREIIQKRGFSSLILIVAAVCFACLTFAGPQGDPALCQQLQAVGERLQGELTQLEANLDSDECQGIGKRGCQSRINEKEKTNQSKSPTGKNCVSAAAHTHTHTNSAANR